MDPKAMRTEGYVALPRDVVERTAKIMGPASAAARALAEASQYVGPVRYWYSAKKSTLLLEVLAESDCEVPDESV